MLRLLLGLVGVGMMIAAGLLKSGVVQRPDEFYKPITIEQILQSQGKYLGYRLRLDHAVVENSPEEIENNEYKKRFPLKGGGRQIFIVTNKWAKFSDAPRTLFVQNETIGNLGMMVKSSDGKESPVKQPPQIYLFRDETESYNERLGKLVSILFSVGGIVTAVAIAWYTFAVSRGRRLNSELDACTQPEPGLCGCCGREKLHVIAQFSTERRSLAGYQNGMRMARVESAWISGRCCHDCYRRLGKLVAVQAIAQAVSVFTLMGVVFGVVIGFAARGSGRGSIPMIVLGVSIAVFGLMYLWMIWRFRRLLGREVYQGLGLSRWNPLGSKIEYCMQHSESQAK